MQGMVNVLVAPSVKFAVVLLGAVPAVFAQLPWLGLLMVMLRSPKFCPIPFCTTNVALLVPTLKFVQLTPGNKTHWLGKNRAGFNTPKYAKAPMAINTTKMAQP